MRDGAGVGGQPLLTYRERRPVAALAPYVVCVWERVSIASVPQLHRTVPNGSAELVCQLGSAPRLVGPQRGPTAAVVDARTTVVGVRFRLAAAASVFGVPASALVDGSVAAAELWGGWAWGIGEDIAGAASVEEAAAVLERAVLARVTAEAWDPDPIVAEAARLLGPWMAADVGSLTASLPISERQLRRRCHASIGLAPKELQRMLRFQGFLALSQGRPRPGTDLAWLAAAAGYADQAHLTRESARLAGRSPRILLIEAEGQCRSVHDHAASYGPLLEALG